MISSGPISNDEIEILSASRFEVVAVPLWDVKPARKDVYVLTFDELRNFLARCREKNEVIISIRMTESIA